MVKSDNSSMEILRPPCGGEQAFVDFFTLLEKRRIDKVDVQFLRDNKISSKGNEVKVVNGLKFLGLINEDGSATEKMQTLNSVGEPFKQALPAIVRTAYNKLFRTIRNIDASDVDDFANCFRAEYNMAPQSANEASRIFIYLAQKSGMPLSSSISEQVETLKNRAVTKNSVGTYAKTKQLNIANPVSVLMEGKHVSSPKGMTRLEYQDKVLLFLPQTSDNAIRAQAAKIAKQLIGMYEADIEEA